MIITFMRICKYYFTDIPVMSFTHHDHKMKNANIVHMYPFTPHNNNIYNTNFTKNIQQTD